MTLAFVPFLALLLLQDPQPQDAHQATAEQAQPQEAAAQAKQPKQIVQSVTEDFQKAVQDLGRPDPNDREAVDKWREKVSALQKEKAEQALKAHEDVLSKGNGLYYRAQLELMAQEREKATETLQKFVDDAGDSDMTDEGKLMLSALLQGSDPQRSLDLFASIDSDQLDADMSRMYQQLARDQDSLKKRAKLQGSEMPEIPVVATVNAPEDFSLANQNGKVLVLDFWATWCPPCRMIIPELVEAQKKYDDVQFVGVTRFYGYGMDFSGEDATVPHGGESKRDLSQEDELSINRTFAKKFDMNYPIVFTEDDVASNEFGISGIPTVYVIDPQGKVVGNVVGAGEGTHEQLVKLIEKARGKSSD